MNATHGPFVRWIFGKRVSLVEEQTKSIASLRETNHDRGLLARRAAHILTSAKDKEVKELGRQLYTCRLPLGTVDLMRGENGHFLSGRSYCKKQQCPICSIKFYASPQRRKTEELGEAWEAEVGQLQSEVDGAEKIRSYLFVTTSIAHEKISIVSPNARKKAFRYWEESERLQAAVRMSLFKNHSKILRGALGWETQIRSVHQTISENSYHTHEHMLAFVSGINHRLVQGTDESLLEFTRRQSRIDLANSQFLHNLWLQELSRCLASGAYPFLATKSERGDVMVKEPYIDLVSKVIDGRNELVYIVKGGVTVCSAYGKTEAVRNYLSSELLYVHGKHTKAKIGGGMPPMQLLSIEERWCEDAFRQWSLIIAKGGTRFQVGYVVTPSGRKSLYDFLGVQTLQQERQKKADERRINKSPPVVVASYNIRDFAALKESGQIDLVLDHLNENVTGVIVLGTENARSEVSIRLEREFRQEAAMIGKMRKGPHNWRRADVRAVAPENLQREIAKYFLTKNAVEIISGEVLAGLSLANPIERMKYLHAMRKRDYKSLAVLRYRYLGEERDLLPEIKEVLLQLDVMQAELNLFLRDILSGTEAWAENFNERRREWSREVPELGLVTADRRDLGSI